MGDEVFYPGEIEARNEVKHRRDGLLLPEDTLADLAKVAAKMKVPLGLHA
jgi:LDH2 family malate/lactate/ureidoglycolate dehydrogenase